MSTTFFVKTDEDPKEVGLTIIEHNKDENNEKFWVIERKTEEWRVSDKESGTPEAVIFRRGALIVIAEVTNLLANNFAEPLMEKYGFENVKWLTIPDIEEKFVVAREYSREQEM